MPGNIRQPRRAYTARLPRRGSPAHLREWWAAGQPWFLHSADWWRRHWGRTGILEVAVADAMPDGWREWLDWHRVVAPDNAAGIGALEADRGEYLGYVRAVGHRRAGVTLNEPIGSIPSAYTKRPVLRRAE